MTEREHTKVRVLRNVISCIFYIIALSVVLVLFGIAEDKFRGHSSPLNDPGYWINQIQNNVHSFIFYITCQFIAASLIIKNLSLKKLFALTCAFIVIGRLIDNNNISILKYLFSTILSYIFPILILFFISIKDTPSSKSEEEPEQAIDELKIKYTKYWYILDILLIGFILFWGTLSDPFGLINYVYGLKNDYIIMELAFGYYFLTVPAILSFMVLIIRMVVSWPKYITSKSRFLSLITIVIVSLISYLVLPSLLITVSPKRMFIKGFEIFVKKNADIDEIRNWLSSLNQEDFVEYESKERVEWREKLDWPEAILKLHPRWAGLSWDKYYKSQVEFSWGSGVVGPWGFVVLNENISNPEFGLSTRREYRSELQNGVYVWCSSN